MALDYEQFKVVLADPEARRTMGIVISDDEATTLLGTEARALAWYASWTRKGQGGANFELSETRAGAPQLSGALGYVRWIGPALLLVLGLWMLITATAIGVESRAGYLESVGTGGYDFADALTNVMWAWSNGPQLLLGGVMFPILATVWYFTARPRRGF